MPPELRDQVENEAPERRRKIEQVWSLLGHLERDALDAPSTEGAWADLEQQLDTTPPSSRAARRPPVRRGRRRAWMGLPIGTGLVVVLLGLWMWQTQITVEAPRGAQRTVTLPDGSTAHLNSDSRLRHRSDFLAWPFVPSGERKVTLEGEAFFEVVRGARPFVVETFNARVEVLGTQFNVRARQGPLEGATLVTLAAGRVWVTDQEDLGYTMILSEAGQVARVGGDAAPPPPSTPEGQLDRMLAWRQQGFAVVNQPLSVVLAEVERRYALSVDVEEGIELTAPMTLFYPRGTTAEKIIHDICLSERCRYRATSRGFALFPAE